MLVFPLSIYYSLSLFHTHTLNRQPNEKNLKGKKNCDGSALYFRNDCRYLPNSFNYWKLACSSGRQSNWAKPSSVHFYWSFTFSSVCYLYFCCATTNSNLFKQFKVAERIQFHPLNSWNMCYIFYCNIYESSILGESHFGHRQNWWCINYFGHGCSFIVFLLSSFGKQAIVKCLCSERDCKKKMRIPLRTMLPIENDHGMVFI